MKKRVYDMKMWFVKGGGCRNVYFTRESGVEQRASEHVCINEALIKALGLEEAEEVCETCGRPPCSECEVYTEAVKECEIYEKREPTIPLSDNVFYNGYGIPKAQFAELMKVRRKGLEKWRRGMACKNIGEAIEWWHCEGGNTCSYCNYYLAEPNDGTRSCHCALGGSRGVCVKEWRAVQRAIHNKDFLAFHAAAKAMCDLIDHTPMIPRKEKP